MDELEHRGADKRNENTFLGDFSRLHKNLSHFGSDLIERRRRKRDKKEIKSSDAFCFYGVVYCVRKQHHKHTT